MHRPVIGFRNQSKAFNSGKLVEAWPNTERQDSTYDKGRPTVAISLLSPNGVRRHVKHTDDATRDDYDNLFKGIFRCDVRLTRPFFIPLLNANFDFIGKSPSPPPPPPPAGGPLGYAVNTLSIGVPVFSKSDSIDVDKFLEREFIADNAIADSVAESLLYKPLFELFQPPHSKGSETSGVDLAQAHHARTLDSLLKDRTSDT